MSNLISWTMSSLGSIWSIMTDNYVLGSVIIISVMNLIATLVIHTMGNNK